MPTTLGASRATGRGRQLPVEEVLGAVELVDELPFEDEDEPDESLDDVEEVLDESFDGLLLSLEESEESEEPEDPESDRESVL